MSRQIFHITLHVKADGGTPAGASKGKPIEGIGRNLPATVQKVYDTAFGKQHGRRVVLEEHLRSGHTGKDEHRYEGTFHARVVDAAGISQEPFVVDVRAVSKAS